MSTPSIARLPPRATWGRGSDHGSDGGAGSYVAALLAMAGLVIDGGYALAARQQAANTAEQAARIGADALSRPSLRSGGPLRVDPAAAAGAARGYLTTVGHAGDVTVSGDTVTVTVRVSQRTAILSAVGVTTITVTGRATASGLTGIDREET